MCVCVSALLMRFIQPSTELMTNAKQGEPSISVTCPKDTPPHETNIVDNAHYWEINANDSAHH